MIYKRVSLFFIGCLISILGLHHFSSADVINPIQTLRMMTADELAKSIIEEERSPTVLNKLPLEMRQFVEFLMGYRFDYNRALIDAVKINQPTYVTDLLSAGYYVDVLDLVGRNSPLLWAAQNNNPEIMNILIENGADINRQNVDGMTALSFATEKGNFESVNYLLSHSIPDTVTETEPFEIKPLQPIVSIDLANTYSETPLMLAAHNNFPDIAELLLSKKADLSIKDWAGRTAWLHAAANGSIDVIRLLLTQYKDKIDINEVDNTGFSALTLAADLGFRKLIELLLENGVNVNDNRYNGLTALHLVSSINNPAYVPKIIELLLAHNADINARSNDGETPLILAIVEGKSKANIATLLKHGADITIADNVGKTALNHAQEQGNQAIIALLEEAATAKE